MTPFEAYDKAYEAGKRLPELEGIIMTSSYYSKSYAEDIIKGRWIEAEDVIMTNAAHSYYYARETIKGKLPDKMHNMMILYAIKDPELWCLKEYFTSWERWERQERQERQAN